MRVFRGCCVCVCDGGLGGLLLLFDFNYVGVGSYVQEYSSIYIP